MFRVTQVPAGLQRQISPTGLSPAPALLSRRFGYRLSIGTVAGPTTPGDASLHPRFGLLRVRSPLLAQSLLFSSPPGTEMFQFPGFAPLSEWYRNRLRWVAPFGNLRVKGYLLLAAAYRSLSRPSSPPRAKASFMCPFLLSFYRSVVKHSLHLPIGKLGYSGNCIRNLICSWNLASLHHLRLREGILVYASNMSMYSLVA